jgi:hypothetical protein
VLKAILTLLTAPTPPRVAVVGHISRTWYADHDDLCAVLEILREHRLYQPVHGGRPPFDLYVEKVCARIGLMDIKVAWGDGRSEFAPRRAGLVDGCCMLVAFPPEGGSLEEAEPGVVNEALAQGLPVLRVNRGGGTAWIRT